MSQCKWCNKSGFFVFVNNDGLCKKCNHLVFFEVVQRTKIINESTKIIRESKNIDTKLSRCQVILLNAQELLKYEQKGIHIIDPLPSEYIKDYQTDIDQLIVDHFKGEVDRLFSTIDLLNTPNKKINHCIKLISKIRELKPKVSNENLLDEMEKKIKDEILKINPDYFHENTQQIILKKQVIKESKYSDKNHEGLISPENRKVEISLDNGFILNPGHPVKLTILNGDQVTAQELKDLLDSNFFSDSSLGYDAFSKKIFPLLIKNNMRCKELEDYINHFKPEYQSKLKELENNPKKQLDEDFDEIIYDTLQSQNLCPDIQWDILFNFDIQNIYQDDQLISKYDIDLLKIYLKYTRDAENIYIIQGDHHDYNNINWLVSLGLAQKGKNIPIKYILTILKLKELNNLMSDLNTSPFTRKDKAIEFLEKLPDLEKRVENKMPINDYYQIKPLPEEFSGIDINKVSFIFEYYKVVAYIITHTYTICMYSQGQWEQAHDSDIADYLWGFKYLCVGGKTGDGRNRKNHLAMAGFVARKDAPIWKIWWTPNGFCDRCDIQNISTLEAKRQGWSEMYPLGEPPDVMPDYGFEGPKLYTIEKE